MTDPIYEGGGFKVTPRILKTPRRTYELKNVELVSTHQPLLLVCCAIGLGLIGFTAAFSQYLYVYEKITLVMCALSAIIAATLYGTMKVHSLALRDDQSHLWGFYFSLKRVREAVDVAMETRAIEERA